MPTIEENLRTLELALENGGYNSTPLQSASALVVESLHDQYKDLLNPTAVKLLNNRIPHVMTTESKCLFLTATIETLELQDYLAERMYRLCNELADQDMLVGQLCTLSRIKLAPYGTGTSWAVFCFVHVKTEKYNEAVVLCGPLSSREGDVGMLYTGPDGE